MVALLIPATSPSLTSISSTLKPFCSPQRRYILKIMLAQSWASVPPEPDWISKKAALGSISPENIRLNSNFSRLKVSESSSTCTSSRVSSSFSSTARSNSSLASTRPVSMLSMVFTTPSSIERSLPSACARSASFHTSGCSNSRSTSSKRSCLPA